MKSSKITALILCFCLMLSMTACRSDNSTENKTNSNKSASGSAVTENKKTSHDVRPGTERFVRKIFYDGCRN